MIRNILIAIVAFIQAVAGTFGTMSVQAPDTGGYPAPAPAVTEAYGYPIGEAPSATPVELPTMIPSATPTLTPGPTEWPTPTPIPTQCIWRSYGQVCW